MSVQFSSVASPCTHLPLLIYIDSGSVSWLCQLSYSTWSRVSTEMGGHSLVYDFGIPPGQLSLAVPL